MSCWAEVLGNCSKQKSGEHYVSQGIFDSKSIIAFGLPWCRDIPVQIGLGSAVANILCEKHNSALSRYDQEATKLSKFLTENVFDIPLNESTIVLNGAFIEKWAIKTFINLGYLRALHREQEENLLPPKYLVEHLYCGTPLPEGAGLYYISGKISSNEFLTGLSWNVIRNKIKLNEGIHQVLGMILIFNGIRFTISLTPERAEEKILSMGLVGDFDYSHSKVYYRPDNITLQSETAGEKKLVLVW